MLSILSDQIQKLHLSPELSNVISVVVLFLGIAIASWLVNYVLKRYIVYFVQLVLDKSKSKWGKLLRECHVFLRLSHLGPALFIYFSMRFLVDSDEVWVDTLAHGVSRAAIIYMMLAIVWFLMSLLNAFEKYYNTLQYSKQHPIRGYLQILKIVIWGIVIIFAIAEAINQSPWAFFTGLGALSAVLMLVFKDTILGFVASIQVSAYDMVRVGDWITIPSYNVDGDVMEVSINTVKVQNFDKTVVSIPTYALISAGVQNWRGMSESGGRRIKRAINIDIDTIKFADELLLVRLKRLDYLGKTLEKTLSEINAFNQEHGFNTELPINGRSLTNVGLFRMYAERYLKNNRHIHDNMTFIVRQLQPTAKGLPIELYVFTNDTDWGRYEAIQADIFDHLLAALPIFDLHAFQDMSSRGIALMVQDRLT